MVAVEVADGNRIDVGRSHGNRKELLGSKTGGAAGEHDPHGGKTGSADDEVRSAVSVEIRRRQVLRIPRAGKRDGGPERPIAVAQENVERSAVLDIEGARDQV